MVTRVLENAAKLSFNGYSVFPTKPGEKVPMVKSWTKYRTEPYPLNKWPEGSGLAVICGGGLEVLDFEGRAVELMLERFKELVPDELLDKLNQWSEKTPSGGYHFYYSVAEPKKRHLAKLANGEVAIETLGEGQYCLAAPTDGYVDLSSEYGTAPSLSEEEHETLLSACRSLTLQAQPQIISVELDSEGESDGDSFMDRAKDWVTRNLTWATLLREYAFTFVKEEEEVQYWRRPGKDEGEYSVTINCQGNDRLINFSSSLYDKFPPSSEGTRSYDRLDLIAAYDFNGDRVKAAKKVVPNLNLCPNLPEDFWKEREVLSHLKQAAYSRGLVPDAVLGTFLAEMSFRMDYRLLLPDVVGKLGVPNIFVALAGTSGAGKSSALQLVKRMLPDEHPTDPEAERVSIGSGEGISKAFYGSKKVEDRPQISSEVDFGEFADKDEIVVDLLASAKSRVVKGIVRRHLYIQIDEGQLLSSLGKRTGSTTMETLRQCWSGDPLGHKNASDDKNFPVPELGYRVSVAMGIQPVLAKELLKDDVGGTPQRFLWVSVDTDPLMPDELPTHPGKLSLRFPSLSDAQEKEVLGGTEYGIFEIQPQIGSELRRENVLRKQGKKFVGKYDSHRDLSKLKVASIFAYVDGRLKIEEGDWQLAETFMKTSDAVRSWTLRLIDSDQKGKEEARTKSRAQMEIQVAEIVETETQKNVIRVAKKLAKRVHEKRDADGAFKNSKVLSQYLGRDYKYRAEAIDYAVEAGWLLRLEGNELTVGVSLPA